MKTENLPCVKVERRRGERVRRALKELELLRTDARITSNDNFVHLPLTRELKGDEKREIEVTELLTAEFELLEQRRSIEDLVGFKPSYEMVGDIAVLTAVDLTGENEQLVAHALMNLHKNIKVVAKRVSPVEGVFRKRKMKVIAGENRTETIHRENGCRYKLDLEKVYFNPRLASERNRVVSQVERSGKEEIIDMFAGVGPFSIQIAKRAPQSHVTAIDANPDAIRYLIENIKLNGLRNVEAIEGDIKKKYERFRNKADRIIMNLPKSAYLFLREALCMLDPHGGIIHFYDLESSYSDATDKETKSHEIEIAAINKAKAKLAAKVKEAGDEFHFRSLEIRDARKVKTYAPYAYIIGIDARIIG
ncbi:MAG TPA: class I SAM-dependent methyltransferase family protein [Methanophagales archaeon]|nr:class I SAM-dependent methyltransferase family protein [Methanophagales archaeon]